MENQKRHVRRIYIINWRFQFRYIVFMIIPIILLGLFAVIIGFRVAYDMASTQRQQLMVMISSLENSLKDIENFLMDKSTLEKAVSSIRALKTFSQDLVAINMLELRRLSYLLVLAMFMLISGAIIVGIFSSHRIAGPIFRLQRHIREMSKNVLNTPIRIRVNDEFQELASTLEELRLVNLDQSNKRHEQLNKLKDVLDKIDQSLGSGSASSREDLDNIRKEVEELKKIC